MTSHEPVFATDRAALVARLRTILPAHCLLVDEEDLRPYECDGLTAYRDGNFFCHYTGWVVFRTGAAPVVATQPLAESLDVTIAICRAKKQHDRRNELRQKSQNLEINRALKHY